MVHKRSALTIPEYGDPSDPNIRKKYGFLEAKISILGNTLLFIIKLILGIYINSIALIADAVHTLSDVGTSGVVLFGFKLSTRPKDKEHPFGHGRIEYIATMIIAISLVLVGLGFIQQSCERALNLVELSHQEFSIIIGLIIIITAIAKELMARISFKIGRKIKSDILVADAWHHRTDAFSSIGVGISIIGASYGYPILDPIFGGLVSIIIIYVGINLIRTTSNFLLGCAPDKELVAEIKKIADSTEGIQGIHALSVHDYGAQKVVTLHINVEGSLPVDKAHQIADELEKKIQKETNCGAIIHIEPARNLKNKKT